MKLIDISDSFKIINGKCIYLQSTISNESPLLIEYLSNSSLESILEELEKLREFDLRRSENDRPALQNYLIDELDCINDYDGNEFAYIAGATDLTVSVLYDFENDIMFLKHPYGPKDQKEIVTCSDLIDFLKRLENILTAFICD